MRQIPYRIPFSIWKNWGETFRCCPYLILRSPLPSKSFILPAKKIKERKDEKAGECYLVLIFCLYKAFVLKNALPQRVKHSCKSHLKFICAEALQRKSSPVQNPSHFEKWKFAKRFNFK